MTTRFDQRVPIIIGVGSWDRLRQGKPPQYAQPPSSTQPGHGFLWGRRKRVLVMVSATAREEMASSV